MSHLKVKCPKCKTEEDMKLIIRDFSIGNSARETYECKECGFRITINNDEE